MRRKRVVTKPKGFTGVQRRTTKVVVYTGSKPVAELRSAFLVHSRVR